MEAFREFKVGPVEDPFTVPPKNSSSGERIINRIHPNTLGPLKASMEIRKKVRVHVQGLDYAPVEDLLPLQHTGLSFF